MSHTKLERFEEPRDSQTRVRIDFAWPKILMLLRKHVVKLVYECGFAWSRVISKHFCPLHHDFFRIRSQYLHSFVDELSERHCLWSVIAVHQVGAHPRRSQL